MIVLPRNALCASVLLALFVTSTPVAAQHASRPPAVRTAADIELGLEKLTVLGSALYVAAHPDDENTALLAYLSRGRHLRAGYLSLTRGDGGQNLIGPEIGDALGVIRTQELLEARRIDGAEQFFTRAIDFGYSKSPEETIEIWGHDAILSDVVWVIRRFRPDVIVTRFPTEGQTHGHHIASARLAVEALEAAADPERFPEQLAHAQPWRVKRVVWNSWRPQLEGRDPSLPPLVQADPGEYSPLLGQSFSELAGASRSMHKSQGFGAGARRGPQTQYFEHLAGEPAQKDLLDGIDTGWPRVKGGARVDALLRGARAGFKPSDPSATVPALLEAWDAMAALEPDPWIDVKRAEVLDLIRACAGLWFEAIAARAMATPGEPIDVSFQALNRSGLAFTLEAIEMPFAPAVHAAASDGASGATTQPFAARSLPANQPVGARAVLALPADVPYSNPYWLRSAAGKGMFEVGDAALLSLPETPPLATATFVVRAGNRRLNFEVPLLYRWVDRVAGERYRRFQVVPPATARFDKPVSLFPDASSRPVRIAVRAHRDRTSGTVRLDLPAGWRAEPAAHAFAFEKAGDERQLDFTVHPPADASSGDASATVEVDGRAFSHGHVAIDYPHIPVQDLFPASRARVVRARIARRGDHVGYLMGSGDAVADALREAGYRVSLLTDDDVAGADLSRFDAIVAGVRAYNTRSRLLALQPRLLDYVKRGGTLVVQYNTRDDDFDERLGPYPFTISRDRVTVEEAAVKRVKQSHPLLTRPNTITDADFDGWVQERGLYFANPWDERYETVLASNDPGEEPLEGGLLYARHGKGVFIYTGYSWFRELPAGVPGAYRLFVNLVSARP